MFLEQAIRLVSQSPDNLAYHILTLLAVQVALALSLGQWRQNPQDSFSGRLAATSALIFLLKLTLALTFATAGAAQFLRLTPPLERATDLLITLALVWAFTPTFKPAPRLNEVIFFLGCVVVGSAYLLAAQEWNTLWRLEIDYAQTPQAFYWSMGQLVVLGVGLVLTAAGQNRDWWLRFLTLLPLLLAHLTHLNLFDPWLNQTELLSGLVVPVWSRLAHLVVFPLLAVIAYRHNLAELLQAYEGTRPLGGQFATLLELSKNVLGQPQVEQTLVEVLKLLTAVVQAQFTAVGQLVGQTTPTLQLFSLASHQTQPQSWLLKLADWPALQMSVHQRKGVELSPVGLGSQQLTLLYKELGLEPQGNLYIEPLLSEQGQLVGLMLLAGPPATFWSADDKALFPFLGRFVGQLLALRLSTPTIPPPADWQLQLENLHKERDQATKRALALADYLQQSREELKETEKVLASEQKRLRDLHEQLQLWQKQTSEERFINLEKELETVRSALKTAEEALAIAAAGEAGLSPEWVMQTITTYSAELEENYLELTHLRQKMAQTETLITQIQQKIEEVCGASVMVTGQYLEQLQSETVGVLTNKQKELVGHIKGQLNLLEAKIKAILPEMGLPAEGHKPSTNSTLLLTPLVDQLLETFLPHIQAKHLTLDLDIPADLPPLNLAAPVVQEISSALLNNAILASAVNGRVYLQAQLLELPELEERVPYLQLTLTDNGPALLPADRPYIFDPTYRQKNPTLIGLGDQSHRLLQIYVLIRQQGGRLWVDSQEGIGNTFSALLPIRPQ